MLLPGLSTFDTFGTLALVRAKLPGFLIGGYEEVD
jgi:hypothetical protein